MKKKCKSCNKNAVPYRRAYACWTCWTGLGEGLKARLMKNRDSLRLGRLGKDGEDSSRGTVIILQKFI